MYLSGEGKSFSTPGFPLSPGNGTCGWNITVAPGEFIKLTFWDFKGSCSQNKVDVWDRTNSTWRDLGRYCYDRVMEFYSRRNNVLVWFQSYWYYSGYPGGFLASFEAVKAVPARYACSRARYWWSKDVISLHSPYRYGDFASYDFPLSYPNDVKCSWKIERPNEYVIRITFLSFNLGPVQESIPGLSCAFSNDYVAIRQGTGGDWTWQIGTFCGTSLPPVIQSNYSNVYVDFVADSSGRYQGFHASYEILINRKLLRPYQGL